MLFCFCPIGFSENWFHLSVPNTYNTSPQTTHRSFLRVALSFLFFFLIKSQYDLKLEWKSWKFCDHDCCKLIVTTGDVSNKIVTSDSKTTTILCRDFLLLTQAWRGRGKNISVYCNAIKNIVKRNKIRNDISLFELVWFRFLFVVLMKIS